MATGGIVNGSICSDDVLDENTCTDCFKSNRVTKATHCCPECDKYFCKACLCDHDVIGAAGMQRWGKPTSKKKGPISRVTVKTCLQHQDNEYLLYCKDHKELCCIQCLLSKHKHCEKVEQVRDIAKNRDLSGDLAAIETSIQSIEQHLHWVRNESN